jgi:hypothetical protein
MTASGHDHATEQRPDEVEVRDPRMGNTWDAWDSESRPQTSSASAPSPPAPACRLGLPTDVVTPKGMCR